MECPKVAETAQRSNERAVSRGAALSSLGEGTVIIAPSDWSNPGGHHNRLTWATIQ